MPLSSPPSSSSSPAAAMPPSDALRVHALPCFTDNYIWLIEAGAGCWVVDPGAAEPVLTALARLDKPLLGVLATHHHADHIGGVAALVEACPAPVLGPAETASVATRVLDGGERLQLDGLGTVAVLAVGAHTRGHLAYHLPGIDALFCGDTLFSAGCGRLFEGTPADLERALARIDTLPADTRLYPAHEYTRANLHFAQAVEADNADIAAHAARVDAWRAENRPSLPTSLALERRINPFLRTHEPAVIASTSRHAGREILPGLDALAALRAWKDVFRA